jgi:uncharacterized coiled-coil protein SlyX
MPTVADLQRLDALTTRLTPLTRMAQGTLIRAEDWNAVVGALVEVARSVLASAREEVVPPHDHPEAVSLAWLDPRVRSLIERGPGGDASIEARLAAIERRLARGDSRTGEVDDAVREVRDRIADVATRDLARETQLTELRRTLGGVADGRDEVTTVRESLTAMRAELATALDVGRRLTVDGQPFDAAALEARLKGVEELRARLTRPDGALLDAVTLEERLTQLTNTLVTEDKLAAALANRRNDLSDADKGSIRDLVTADLQATFGATVAASEDRLRGELTTRLSDIDASVGRAVNDAIPALRGDILASAREEFTTTLDSRLKVELDATRTAVLDEAARQMRGVAQDEAKASTELLRRDIDGIFKTRSAEISAGIMVDVQRQMDAALSDQKSTFDRQLTSLQGNLLPALVKREVAALQPELEKSIDVSVTRRIGR